MPGLKLKIRQPELNPRSARVWLDDEEITTGLTGVSVCWSVGDVTTAELSVTVDDLDVDAQTLVHLAAHVRDKGDEPQPPHPSCVEITSGLDTERRYVCGADCPGA